MGRPKAWARRTEQRAASLARAIERAEPIGEPAAPIIAEPRPPAAPLRVQAGLRVGTTLVVVGRGEDITQQSGGSRKGWVVLCESCGRRRTLTAPDIQRGRRTLPCPNATCVLQRLELPDQDIRFGNLTGDAIAAYAAEQQAGGADA